MGIALNNLHHAYLLVGAPEQARSYLDWLCDGLGLRLDNNPDFFLFRMDTFGVDEARELRILATRKAVTGRKIFFITPARITLEAQNALLKTFEDPFPHTHFFLIVREEALVEPTLLSRMRTIRLNTKLDLIQTGQNALLAREAERFLSLTLKDRLLFAKEFADGERDLTVLLDNLLLLLRKKGQAGGLVRRVYDIRRFAYNPAVFPRLMIEHLSLVL